MSMRTILGVLVSTLLVAGCAGATGTAAPAASAPAASSQASVSAAPAQASASASAAAAPSTPGAFGGAVQFKYHGQPSTTTVDAAADGTSVSGTAVTQIGKGTHTVQLGCAAQTGDTWAVAGKTEKSDVEGGRAGDWSAVIVKPGSPARIGIWVSDDASIASDCDGWLKVLDLPTLDLTGFETVESGTLTPPTFPAP
jgi:hypothetical protein